MKINVRISPLVFNAVYIPFLDAVNRIQIFFGGSSSGKSVFLAERCVYDLLKGGRNYLVLRNTGNTIRTSVFNEILKVIFTWRLHHEFTVNRSDMTITCRNGFQVIFKGLDDVQKIKSITPVIGVITDIWVEEATETKREDLKELEKRLRGIMPAKYAHIVKRITLSFNPISRAHWIFKEYFEGNFNDADTRYADEGLSILKTTYKDNRFLAPEDIRALESEKDEFYYKVYTLGEWGVLGNLVFKNWRVDDLSSIRDTFDYNKNGLDFGYSNDPTCFTRSAKSGDGKTIYVPKGFYERGMTNDMIADRLRPVIGDEPILCDSSEPKSIRELQNFGVNAYSALKGPGSLSYGIQWLQRHEIVIDRSLQGIINDFSLYQWRKNKDGEVMNEPIDKDNHGPDSIRYAWSDDLTRDREYEANDNAHTPRTGALSKEALGLA